MSKKKGPREWRNKMFLLQAHEQFYPDRKKKYFANGEWCIYQDSLIEIMKHMSEPRIEEEKIKKKLCLMCAEQELDCISHKVRKFADYTEYYDRDSLIIVPSLDYVMHYYEISVPYGKRKERTIIEQIDTDQPADIFRRSKYYFDQTMTLSHLQNGLRKCGGFFLLCPQHDQPQTVDKVLKKMVRTAYYWRGKHRDTESRYFYAMLPVPVDFIRKHYTVDEIAARDISSEGLEAMIEKYAYLAGDFSL